MGNVSENGRKGAQFAQRWRRGPSKKGRIRHVGARNAGSVPLCISTKSSVSEKSTRKAKDGVSGKHCFLPLLGLPPFPPLPASLPLALQECKSYLILMKALEL